MGTAGSIVHVIEAAAGGSGRQVALFAAAQAEAGHEVTVIISPRRRDPDFADRVAALTGAGCRVELLPMDRNPGPADFAAIGQVRRLIREAGATVLHTHCAKAGLVGRLAAAPLRRDGLRVLHTPHSWYLHGLNGIMRRLALALERHLAARTDCLFCVSEEEAADAATWGIIPAGRVVTAVNGLPPAPPPLPAAAARERLGLPPAAPVFGSFARLSARKNPAALIHALTRLPPDTRLALVGTGELEAALRRLAVDLGVSDRVHFCGFVPDAAACIGALDVAVLPSAWEGRSLFAMEALAAGVPLVATDAPGNRFIAAHGGILAASADPVALAAAITTAFTVTRSPVPMPTLADQMAVLNRCCQPG